MLGNTNWTKKHAILRVDKESNPRRRERQRSGRRREASKTPTLIDSWWLHQDRDRVLHPPCIGLGWPAGWLAGKGQSSQGPATQGPHPWFTLSDRRDSNMLTEMGKEGQKKKKCSQKTGPWTCKTTAEFLPRNIQRNHVLVLRACSSLGEEIFPGIVSWMSRA